MTDSLIKVDFPNELGQSIETFSSPLASFLRNLELPTTDILASIEDRKIVISQLERVLEKLPTDSRNQATYLTRFSVAVSVGLFDGALNYLWNETIKALRNLVNELT